MELDFGTFSDYFDTLLFFFFTKWEKMQFFDFLNFF